MSLHAIYTENGDEDGSEVEASGIFSKIPLENKYTIIEAIEHIKRFYHGYIKARQKFIGFNLYKDGKFIGNFKFN